ncbi:uncharacterized protein Triagg1_6355 [Trichoderma aggressivum f. europaeum]|uniref:Nephrocystin 3-like N-terminal domain-containing protein n=1 Tax=Trichoderma aggressivum f. europaeum TaxID=173218 RepID=A0AAE1LYL9_9HYPO|nr:hypothetical protein Triagg1_6355 [Trichoderma aggressivum f. europaeum]
MNAQLPNLHTTVDTTSVVIYVILTMASLSTGGQNLPSERQTFRVRGVPHDWNRDGLASFLAENSYTSPDVQTLANETHGRSQTATVTVQRVPSQLQERLADPVKGIALYIPSSDQHSRPRSLMLDTAFLGVTTLYAPLSPDHEVDIIVISGLGGRPFGTFKERQGEYMWLRDALSYDVTEKSDDKPISRIMVYGYNSNSVQSDSFQNLQDLGTAFHRHLRKLAVAGAFKPIVFIAHSIVGLVLKQTFISLYKSNDEEDQKLLRAVYGIAFSGVPHHGMDINSLIPMVKFGPEGDEDEKVVGLLRSLVREARQTQQRRHPSRQISPAQIEKCLQSLAFEHVQDHASGVSDALSGTCKWLLQHETYISWISSSHGLLWIKGKPGSGKSTLLKHAFTHQSLSNTANDDMFISFFFRGRGNELQKTPFGLFRSLLYQLLKQAPDTLLDLVDTYTQKCRAMGNYQEKWRWHPDDLWRFLESSLTSVLAIRSVWLFVDALDECGEKNARDLASKFQLLVEKMRPLSSSGKQLRICFSCRHYPILSSISALELCLEKENRGDISTYVRSELSSFGESIPITIPALIIDRASGVFLWAELVVKHVVHLGLNGHGPTEIAAAVHSIPKGLDELYDGLVHSMTPSSLKLIKWVCFAKRPLSVSELRWAMAINAEYSSLNACQNANDYIPDDSRMKKQIVKLSQGLAEVTMGPNPIVQFIHQSVKDFFTDKGLSKLVGKIVGGSISRDTAIGRSHLELSKSCIQYFAMEEIVQFTSYEKQNLYGDYPFLHYAISSWMTHLKESENYTIAPEGILELFGWPEDDLSDIWTELYNEMDEDSDGCPIDNIHLDHVAARYDLKGVMNAILQSDGMTAIGVDTPNGDGMTPLALAAQSGHEAMVKLLLAISHVEIDTKSLKDRTPLFLAAEEGHVAIASLLLATKQVDVNVKDNEEGQTPLSSAAKNGHEAMVGLLLATGQAEIDSKSSNHQTPLSLAAENGHEAVVRLLLATGQAEIDAKDATGWTALSWAVTNEHESVVKLLLATGQVDINVKDLFGRTPLLLAALSGSEAIVKLLLATGQAEIGSRDCKGYTPLSWATKNGHEAVADLLQLYALSLC